jgi:mRNA-degrading endonuclease RelE of RelBE toxin-antitoxin system
MLRRELTGAWSARRGTYRVLYRINDTAGEVVVLRIDHLSDVYHRCRAGHGSGGVPFLRNAV